MKNKNNIMIMNISGRTMVAVRRTITRRRIITNNFRNIDNVAL
jgi:hypothetical protein